MSNSQLFVANCQLLKLTLLEWQEAHFTLSSQGRQSVAHLGSKVILADIFVCYAFIANENFTYYSDLTIIQTHLKNLACQDTYLKTQNVSRKIRKLKSSISALDLKVWLPLSYRKYVFHSISSKTSTKVVNVFRPKNVC